MRLSYTLTGLALATALTGCVEPSPVYYSGRYTNPTYTIEAAENNIEVRDYNPILVAEITEQGNRETAMRRGYAALSSYFQGNNDHDQIIPVTEPVIEFPLSASTGRMPAMNNGEWVVRFVLPVEFTLTTVPQPDNAAIRVFESDPARVLALRYSGPWTDDNIQNNTNQLAQMAANDGLQTTGVPAYAFYDQPSMAPWHRHNEILMKLAE